MSEQAEVSQPADVAVQEPGPEVAKGDVDKERVRTGKFIHDIMTATGEDGTPIGVDEQIDRMDTLYHTVASRFDELLDAGDFNTALAERTTVVGMRRDRLIEDYPNEAAAVKAKMDKRGEERVKASAARKAGPPPGASPAPTAS